MSTTPHLDVTELGENQASPDVTVNEALGVLDCAIQVNVIDMTTTAPPGGESDGDRYIIAATASGDWTGLEDQIACYVGTTWRYLVPVEGWEAYDADTNSRYLYDGSNWIRKGGQGDAYATKNPSASDNIDFEIEKQYWDLTGNVTTLGNTNLPAAGQARTVDVLVDLNTYTITWPATSVIDWGTTGAPTQNTDKLLWMRFVANSAKCFAFSLGEFTP